MKKTETAENIRIRMKYLLEIAPDSIGNQFQFELIDSDEVAGEYTFRCKTEKWMRNAYGTLHGGISSTILDQAMGFVVVGMAPERGFTPTIQMQQYYHKFFVPGESAKIVVKIDAVSKALIHMRAEMYSEGEKGTLCVSATAIYYRLNGK